MAPEQAAGQGRDVGPAADVYALGAILYECLTGRPPFKAATPLDTLLQVLADEPVPPTRLQPKVPRDLETICLKCLEKEPDRRYASALDLADDLHRFLSEEPIRARPTSLARQTFKWVRRRPALAALIVVIFVAVLSVGGLLGWHTADRAAHQREQDKIAHELAEEKARQEAQTRYRTFIQQRDEALFHTVVGTPQFTGLDPVASLQAARRAAGQALAAVADDNGLLAPSPYWSERELADIRGGCYELLLLLADVLLRAAPPQAGPPPPEVEEAGRYLERAARLAPPTWAYHRRRARYLERAGDVPGADRELQQAQALKPTSAADRFLQGDEYYRDHDLKKARHEFDQALHQEPDHFWAQYYVALCDLELKSTWAAEAGLTACLGRRPDFVWTYLVRGFANSQLHEFEDAEGDFQKGLGLNPNAAAQYALFVNRGALYMEWGRLDSAKDDLERARALNPDPCTAYLNLAMLARRRQEDDAALHWFDEALRRNPPREDRAAAHANCGDIFYRQQQYDQARRACTTALEADPDYTPALGVLGQALLKQGKFQEAEKAFTDYLVKGGKPHPDIFRGRGNARSELGDYAAALQDYSRLLPDRPGAELPDADLYNHRGWAYVFVDAWRLALADFEMALKGDARDVEPLIGRGLCRVMLGSYREAVPDAEAAWKRQPTTPQMMHNLACIFAQAAGRAAGDREALEGGKQAAEYRARAVQALEEGLRLVPLEQRNSFWRDRMSPDPVLDPIRESAEFRELAQRYAGNKPPE
jgi:tetratricopeptide (TPR) repeat protein